MDLIFPQHNQITSPESPVLTKAPSAEGTLPPVWSRDRIERLSALTQEDKSAGLIWLALHYPATCDAVLDALEYDDEEAARQEPEPYCATCDTGIGIFLRFGLEWRHFRADSAATSQIELFDAGHAP